MVQKEIYNFITGKFFFVLAIFFSLLLIYEGVRYLSKNDAVDLGYRITGARLLKEGESPYLYKWKEGDNKKFYNQYEVYTKNVNGVTVPPSILILMRPFIVLEDNHIKWVWTVLSYGFLGGIIFLFFKLSNEEYKFGIIAIGLFFFAGSIGWLLHVQRGQNYIVYVFLLSLLYYLYKRGLVILSLIVLSFLIWLRFPFAIFLLPFIPIFKNLKYLCTFFISILLLIVITLLCSSIQNWQDYFYAITEWSKAQVAQSNLFSDSESLSSKTLEVASIINEQDYLINNSSIQYLVQYHLKIGLYKIDLLALFMLGSIVIVYPIRRLVREGAIEPLFLVSFMLYFIFELCIPAPRYNYNYIQWIFPVLLIVVSLNEFKIKPYQWCLGILGLLMNMGLFIQIPRSFTLGEFLLFLVFWLTLLCHVTKTHGRHNRNKVGVHI